MNTAGQRTDIGPFLEEAFAERIGLSPQTLTLFGHNERQDELDDYSEAGETARANLARRHLQGLDAFDYTQLDPENQLNYRLFRRDCHQVIERYNLRLLNYRLDQKFGLHAEFPAFMANMHRIDSEQDALNYLARLRAFRTACRQLIESVALRRDNGVVLPGFLLEQIASDCKEILAGLQSPEDSMIHEDFVGKLGALDSLTRARREALTEECINVLASHVAPAYQSLVSFVGKLETEAPAEGGLCSLPGGAAYYRACLAWETTTDLDADHIYQLGLTEVARLQDDIRQVMERLDYAGDLQAFFDFTRDDPRFYYPQTDKGRESYLFDLQQIIDRAEQRLPELFHVLPVDPLQVRAVERHREQTAGMAFYHGPATDGSRPGTFYINLHDLGQLPTFTMEALAFHEALPGHHMQFAIANRLASLPTFRRYANCNAYVEGWGLYGEQVAHEIDLYADDYGDYGRLTQALKRACRLVVDTGLHARGWTREEAVEYLHHNLPASRAQCVAEVDRYLIMPGQATTYTLGLLEILRLRELASAELGEQFDLRAFHDQILGYGPLPLDVLAERIESWIRVKA